MAAFHAWSGCDATSSFFGFGKVSCKKAWENLPQATTAFLNIVDNPFKILQSLCCVLYDKSTKMTSVNELRRHLFTKKGRAMEKIPPNEDSYLQHCNRLVYQVGYGRTAVTQ
eukprot:Lithocolla_globosa_v1_NODE_1580_length_2470_cov_13.390476.p3 type:complete len:112 gc:universal NODE_1580_length_2470_cov_13.390476:1509-1844(+)